MTPVAWEYGAAFTDGEIVRFFVGTKKYGDLWAVVDAADWPAIADSRWRATKRKNLFYVRDGSHVLLHRVLTNFGWPVVDHRDGNGLNNRRGNLQRCETNAENTIYGGERRRGETWDGSYGDREVVPTADRELWKWLSRTR